MLSKKGQEELIIFLCFYTQLGHGTRHTGIFTSIIFIGCVYTTLANFGRSKDGKHVAFIKVADVTAGVVV
jgi:hypothetical protein